MRLAELQRQFAGAIMTSPDLATAKAARQTVGAIVKPNSRLMAMDRFEIYRDSYWARILGCFADDYPGLRGILGQRAFDRLAKAYLLERPSESFTLRNLGSSLNKWLAANREYCGDHFSLALDMARLEWAQVEAFDGARIDPVGAGDLNAGAERLRFGLQPHLSLLALRHPVDHLRLQLVEFEDSRRQQSAAVKKFGVRERVFLSVHRPEFTVYYRRLAASEFRILTALREGATLGEAVEGVRVGAEEIRAWFAAWAQLGWLTRYQKKSAS